MSDETEIKQAEVKKFDEFAKQKAQQELARTIAFNNQVLGGVGLAMPYGAQANYPQPNAEMMIADAIRNLAGILEQLSRVEHEAIAELRQHIKDTIKKLL